MAGVIINKISSTVERFATKDIVSKLEGDIEMKFVELKDDIKIGNENIDRILNIVSDPTLLAYKQSWKDLKLYLIIMRDTYYVMKHSFEDKWTNNRFYKFFHYKEYKEYLKNVALFNYTQTILSRLEELEKENMILNINEDECNE